MKIFSNFDTKLKQKELVKWTKVYGKKNVLWLSKSKLFHFLKIDLPLLLYAITMALLMWVFFYFLGSKWVIFGALPLALLGLFFVIPRILKHLMDYHMDFIIITPKILLRYDQEGIFHRDMITINVHNIKTISVRKSWLLYSIFDDGDIIFLSEGDAYHGEITLEYISSPEKKKYEIGQIMRTYWQLESDKVITSVSW